MNPECGKEWSRKYIRELFTLVFINGPLKEHREKLLFDKERALLPATQPIIEAKNQIKKLDKQTNLLRDEISKLYTQIAALNTQKEQIQNKKIKTGERSSFVRACPEEDCRGFLSSQWKCGVCEKWTCPECHIVKGYTRDAAHTCNADDLATAQLLASDTKPCPSCGTGITKIDGCDQMWCPECKKAFSWRTGRIETNIHNPHYFEWMRRGGVEAPRNPNDVLCGRNLDHYLYDRISRVLRLKYKDCPNFRVVLSLMDKLIRNAIHIINVERPRPIDYETRNQDLRVEYLMKHISEKDMQDQLQRDDKRHHRNNEVAEVFTLLTTTTTDILYRFLDFIEKERDESERNLPIDTTILSEVQQIVDYANECMEDISHTYSCSRVIINPDLSLLKGQSARNYIREMKIAIENSTLENTFVEKA